MVNTSTLDANPVPAQVNFKLKGAGAIKFHLGCNSHWDDNGTLCVGPLKHIDPMIDSHNETFPENPNRVPNHHWRKRPSGTGHLMSTPHSQVTAHSQAILTKSSKKDHVNGRQWLLISLSGVGQLQLNLVDLLCLAFLQLDQCQVCLFGP